MKRTLLLPFLLIALAALVVACGDDDEDNSAEAAEDHVDAGAILAALGTLERAELHAVNLALVEDDPTIDPAWLGNLRNARTAVAVIAWPTDLEEFVDGFLAESAMFEAALAEDDVATAAEHVGSTHAAFHVLSGAAYEMLAAEAGLETSGESHGDHDASGDDHDDEAMDDESMDHEDGDEAGE